jgi:hypothetical protein
MPCSVARALGSTLIILFAGANIRGPWQRILGHCFGFHTMGCRPFLDQGLLLERLVWMLKALDAARRKSKGKNSFGNTNITRLECGTAPL